jgi:hypothetical protein
MQNVICNWQRLRSKLVKSNESALDKTSRSTLLPEGNKKVDIKAAFRLAQPLLRLKIKGEGRKWKYFPSQGISWAKRSCDSRAPKEKNKRKRKKI